MSMQENESSQGDLDTLPANEQKETKEILDQIAQEQNDKNPVEKKPEDTKDEVKPKPEDTKEDLTKKPDEIVEDDSKKRRDVSLVPAYKMEILKQQHEKKVKDLQDEITRISQGAKPVDQKKDDEEGTKDVTADRIKEALEKFQVDVPPEFMATIVEIARDGKALPAEVTDKLKEIDRLTNERNIEIEELNYSKDFDKLVLPIIKAEYGDDVTEETISKIKESLKGIAYTPEYAKISYDEIYRGKQEFRGVVAPKKKSAESTRGADVNLDAGEKDYTQLTEEEAKALNPEEFEKWSNAMAKAERKQS